MDNFVESLLASCAKCIFFRIKKTAGICHRYPEKRDKQLDDWCGEFVNAAENTFRRNGTV
jgi:hypothetical protein